MVRRFLLRLGLVNYKVGDKVKPNPRIFQESYQLVEGQDYAVIKSYNGWIIRLEGNQAIFNKLELIPY